jgi:SAM-dependent methyltransferase
VIQSKAVDDPKQPVKKSSHSELQMKTNDYVKANQAAWNEAAPFHERSQEFEELLKNVGRPDFSCLDDTQTQWLSSIGVVGKDVVHLCCNNGRELLSLEKMGAARCVGFDASVKFIEQARCLAQAGNSASEFVESDVYEISNDFDQRFDLCIITIGVFGWMPDLERFFEVIYRLLRPGGTLFIHEEHPIVNMFEPDSKDPHRPVNSYFQSDPFVESDIIVYDGSDGGSGTPHYWFVHTLSDVLSACLKTGIRLDEYREFEDNISSDEYDIFEDQEAQLPLSYILVATKLP